MMMMQEERKKGSISFTSRSHHGFGGVIHGSFKDINPLNLFQPQ